MTGWALRRPALRELLLVAAVYELYSLSRIVAAGSPHIASRDARRLLHLEHSIGLSPERWLNYAVSGRAWLAVPADYAYATLHYLLTPAVLLWLWRRHPLAYPSARRSLTVATLLGLVGFTLLPTAPPRMLPGFIDTMARYAGYGWWSGAASAPRGLGALTNEYAAMPSLHVGWAIWCAWQVGRNARRRWVRVAVVGYPVAMVFVVVGTGNHYLIDAAGGAAAIVFGAAADRVWRRVRAGRALRGSAVLARQPAGDEQRERVLQAVR